MVGVGAAIAGLALATASPASAHDSQKNLMEIRWGPNLQVAHGGVNDNHTHVWICDDRTDKKGVAISWRLRNGSQGSTRDQNGSQGGCGGAFPGTASNPIVTYWLSRDGGLSTKPFGA